MPAHIYQPAESPGIQSDHEFLHALQDHEFDQIYPEDIGWLSPCHWSPVEVCRLAAQLLVQEPGTRVLDIGCGPGKFCAIGAATTSGHFTGVEQRKRLVKAARDMLKRHRITRAEIVHGNITRVQFRAFDAFYLFNPFEENILPRLRIDHDVAAEPELYDDYTSHVRQQLEQMPMTTRVVTYFGSCVEIPDSYACVKTACEGALNLWVKTRPGHEDDSAC